MSAGKLLYRILTDCDRDVQIWNQRFKDIKASLHRALQCLICLQKWPLKVLTLKKKKKYGQTFAVFSLPMLWWQVPESLSLPAAAVGIVIKLNVTCPAHTREWCSGLCMHVDVVALACCVSCLAKHCLRSSPSAMSLWLLGFCHVLSVIHHGLWIQFSCYRLRFFVVDVMLRFFGTSLCLYLWFKGILVTQSQVVYKS